MRLRGTDGPAPPERLAAFRIVLGVFVVAYLSIRSAVFLELGGRSADRFDPVGVFRLIDAPMAGLLNSAVLLFTIAAGVAFTLGWRFRASAPVFSIALLVVTSHRSSWGQMLHFENLMVLHAFVVAFSPAADAWSLDARSRTAQSAADRSTRTGRRDGAVGADGVLNGDVPNSEGGVDRYGFPLLVASVIVVVTYAIAGFAKLRYGGIEWIAGDTLRNHIAYSATRLELLGGWASPAARWAVGASWMLPPLAALSVLIELAAPVALLGGRWRNAWVGAAWGMHVGIYVLMLVGFPSPLFLVAFAPMFPLERGLRRAQRWRSVRQFSA